MDKRLQNMLNSEYIRVKELGNDIVSLNFTRNAFQEGVWNDETIKARGLFINKVDGDIVARSYNKFFQYDENPETKDYVDNHLAYLEFGQLKDRWWSCQREHFSQWAISQSTEGVEGYRHKPNTNSIKMYNSIGRPELLLWLIEALHISLDMGLAEFRGFVVELSKLGRKSKKQCSKIREKYPYEIVEGLLCTHKGKIGIND